MAVAEEVLGEAEDEARDRGEDREQHEHAGDGER
jgi:hypothetical protein